MTSGIQIYLGKLQMLVLLKVPFFAVFVQKYEHYLSPLPLPGEFSKKFPTIWSHGELFSCWGLRGANPKLTPSLVILLNFSFLEICGMLIVLCYTFLWGSYIT